MPCMCGATDCPSCGPAQGYEVRRVWRNNRYVWINPEPEDGEEEEVEDFEPDFEPNYDLFADDYRRTT